MRMGVCILALVAATACACNESIGGDLGRPADDGASVRMQDLSFLAEDLQRDLAPANDLTEPPPSTRRSCQRLFHICGPLQKEDCCASSRVPGGTFLRSNDSNYPATVSGFSLDRFEVTVGRFRNFVQQYPIAPLAVGQGGIAGVAGSGWQRAWDQFLPASRQDLETALECQHLGTYTVGVGGHESWPISCVSWYVAFLFCAWDGGRLPSEAEWNYAAAGGAEQRVFPWGGGDPSTREVGEVRVTVGSTSPAGDGRWGHADLIGGNWEWALDVFGSYPIPCADCVQTMGIGNRVKRGATADYRGSNLTTAYRNSYWPDDFRYQQGLRCVAP